jgi:hypothetical protein
MRILAIAAIAIAAIIGITLLGLGGGWFGAGANVVSAGNVREQFRDGYTNYESLNAIAANYCSAQSALAATTEPSERSQRITQVAAQEQNYNRVAANYNAAMRDAFRAKFVKPGDLPETAPTFAAATRDAGC